MEKISKFSPRFAQSKIEHFKIKLLFGVHALVSFFVVFLLIFAGLPQKTLETVPKLMFFDVFLVYFGITPQKD